MGIPGILQVIQVRTWMQWLRCLEKLGRAEAWSQDPSDPKAVIEQEANPKESLPHDHRNRSLECQHDPESRN